MERFLFLAAFAAFPFLWSGVVWVIGIGWRSIAEAYPAHEWPRGGHRVSRQSAQIGAASYSSVLTFVATERGLYVRPFLLFRVGHPALFIPWEAVRDVEPAPHLGGRLRLASGHTITVPQELGEAVARAAEAHRGAAHEARVGPLADPAPLAPEAGTERGGPQGGSRRAGSETGWV